MAKPQSLAHHKVEKLRFVNEVTQTIVTYTGGKNALTRFKAECEEALCYVTEEFEKELVSAIVRMKISFDVKEKLLKKQYEKIKDLIIALKQLEKKDKTNLMIMGELGSMRQGENESVRAFAKRIQNQINMIEDTYESATPGSEPRIPTNLKEIANETFKFGIKQIIGDKIIWNPDFEQNIEEAIKREDELTIRELIRNEKSNANGKMYSINTCHETNKCDKTEKPLSQGCTSCGRTGHQTETCWSYDKPIQSAIICQLCNRKGHTANNCQMNNNRKQQSECQIGQGTKSSQKDKQPGQIKCHYCHLNGHRKDTCRKKRINDNKKLELKRKNL